MLAVVVSDDVPARNDAENALVDVQECVLATAWTSEADEVLLITQAGVG